MVLIDKDGRADVVVDYRMKFSKHRESEKSEMNPKSFAVEDLALDKV